MIEQNNVFMTHTRGIDGDFPKLISHIEAPNKTNADLELYSADRSYDSFLGSIAKTSE
jgi:hypothetical protein